nr:uncharacterized protein LOC128703196 isoform X1 [Cherax quadricarinatus]
MCYSDNVYMYRDDLRSGCSPEHRCVKCDRKFMTASALISHDKFCSLLQMRPDILPENPLNPRLRSETPEKKIAIQIRKDYKKTMIPHSPNKTNREESPQNQKTFKVPEIPKEQEKENQRKIEMMMSEFCNMTRLTCIPCEKRYQTITTLKRHASQHFSWTRFACKQCKFRSYHKYETVRHCISDHKANEHNAGTMIIDDESFGPLRYFLASEDDTSVSSDIDELDSHASRSRSTSASSDKISTGHFNDIKNSKEKGEGNSVDIRQTVVIKESVNMSDAKDISNDIQATSTKDENEVSKDNITTEESSDNVKLSDVQDKEKDPDYKDKIKIESINLTKFDTSVDSAKFSLQNTDGKLLETNTTEPFNSQSLNVADLEQSSVRNVRNYLSENKNCEIETVNECKHTKESTNIREYFLRGLTESTSNRNQVYEDAEEARFERPQRLRRSVEQKDFIYNIRISGLQKSEIDAGKRCSPLKKDLECKSNGKHGTRRKNSFSKSEMISKKVKVNDEGAPREACNGDTQLHLQNKCEHVQNKCASVHSDTSDKGSSSHLISTNTNIDSSKQLEIEEEHVQLELLDSDSSYCHLSKKMNAENPFVNSKPDSSNNNSKSVLLIDSATTKTILIECHEDGSPTLSSSTMEKNVLEAESETNIQVIDEKLLETDIVEGSPIATHIFENGRNQEYSNEEKSNKVTQLDNCEDKFWEDGKVKNIDKDINLEEQKPVLQTTRSLNVPANND